MYEARSLRSKQVEELHGAIRIWGGMPTVPAALDQTWTEVWSSSWGSAAIHCTLRGVLSKLLLSSSIFWMSCRSQRRNGLAWGTARGSDSLQIWFLSRKHGLGSHIIAKPLDQWCLWTLKQKVGIESQPQSRLKLSSLSDFLREGMNTALTNLMPAILWSGKIGELHTAQS